MIIDKKILQKLLWAEVGAYRAGGKEWTENLEALHEFLGERTVEEVALELLAENDRLTQQLAELIEGLPREVAVHD
jgi:hypothetical protein